jgi:hypothetical protein
MDSGVVYGAWLAGGAVAVDRDGQAASSSTPIDRWAGCGCARWHVLYRCSGVGRQLHGVERKRWRCQTREDSAGQAAVVGELGVVGRAGGVLSMYSAGHEWRCCVWQRTIGTTGQGSG